MICTREGLYGKVTCEDYGGALGDKSTVGRIHRLRKSTLSSDYLNLKLQILLMNGMGESNVEWRERDTEKGVMFRS